MDLAEPPVKGYNKLLVGIAFRIPVELRDIRNRLIERGKGIQFG